MADWCVRAEGLGKKFARSLHRSFVYGAQDISRLLLRRGPDARLRDSEFWAVRDVSFGLERGRSLGIIGQNGSGKTTLLRLLCGILRPTLGHSEVRGRIAPMLALGAGFKPVLSGRENVFLNLALLGCSEREARDRFAAIVDFAELHDAIDAPLGTYSSGMQARLGFACAVHTEPSLLVVDEVLSVGDARFRMKCRNRINELRKQGTALLLVSHSAVLVEALSDQCLYLRGGRPVRLGPPREVLKAYEDDAVQAAATGNTATAAAAAARALPDGQPLGIRGVELRLGEAPSDHWVAGRDAALVVRLACRAPVAAISVNAMLFDLVHQPGETVQFLVSSRDAGYHQLPAGEHAVVLRLPQLGLRPGAYRLKLGVSQGALHDQLDVLDDVRVVVRDGGGADHCLYFQPRRWEFSAGEPCAAPAAAADAEAEAEEA